MPDSIKVKSTKRIDSPSLAIGFYIGNLGIMVLLSALVKVMATNYPVSQIIFFRYAFAAIPLFVYMTMTNGVASVKTNRYRDHAIRTTAGILSVSLFFSRLQ